MENKSLEIRKLPTIEQLYNDDNRIDLAKQNQLNQLLNQNPNEKWLKLHPIVKGLIYIPIQRIEWLLTNIFINWNVEIKTIQLIANSVVVSIRLNYQSPVTGDYQYQDGVGAAPLQTDKDKGAADWNFIKASAVQIAAPAAETYAIKDAAEKIGKLFGKDLNRADQIGYDNLMNKFDGKKEELTKENVLVWKNAINHFKTNKNLNAVKDKWIISPSNENLLIQEATNE